MRIVRQKHPLRCVSDVETHENKGGDSAFLRSRLPKPDALASYQQQAFDRFGFWNTGAAVVDKHLPDAILNRSGLHEIEPLRATDMPSLTGFAFALLARLRSSQPIIWCVTEQQVGDCGHPYAHGLERFGISPAQIVFAKVSHPLHLHFAIEEALKTDGVAAVLGEGPRPSFVGSRRLSMLCRTHNRPCLLMNAQQYGEHGSAALTRWQIAPCLGEEDPLDPFGPGLPTWRVALPRARGGHTMPDMQSTSTEPKTSYPWRLCWDDQTHSFRETALFSRPAVRENPHQIREQNETLLGNTG